MKYMLAKFVNECRIWWAWRSKRVSLTACKNSACMDFTSSLGLRTTLVKWTVSVTTMYPKRCEAFFRSGIEFCHHVRVRNTWVCWQHKRLCCHRGSIDRQLTFHNVALLCSTMLRRRCKRPAEQRSSDRQRSVKCSKSKCAALYPADSSAQCGKVKARVSVLACLKSARPPPGHAGRFSRTVVQMTRFRPRNCLGLTTIANSVGVFFAKESQIVSRECVGRPDSAVGIQSAFCAKVWSALR